MSDEVFQIMIIMGVFILPMFTIIIVQDFLHVKERDKLLDKYDALWEKYCGKQK